MDKAEKPNPLVAGVAAVAAASLGLRDVVDAAKCLRFPLTCEPDIQHSAGGLGERASRDD